MSVVATMAFGIQAGKESDETSAKLISHLARLAQLRIDVVSNGIPGLKGHNVRKFRKSGAAFEYLENETFSQLDFGLTERADTKGDWDIGSAGYSNNDRTVNLVFPGIEPRGDGRVLSILNEFVRFGAHYAYAMEVESHLYALCYSHGTALSGRMPSDVVENMSILGNAMRRGENFVRRVVDVFPMQILNAEHLSAIVGRRAMRAWIDAESWGHLQPVGPDRWLWALSGSDISRVRKRLLGTELMLAKI